MEHVVNTPPSRQPSRSQRARITNDPLALPTNLSLTTAIGRRWRDLAVTYAEQLGPERMQREDVRARVGSLVWLTIELERMHDARVSNTPVKLHTILHMTQEQRALIAELGLSEPGTEQPFGVANYLKRSRTE